MSAKVRLATVWLDGCSGCHMSLLDIDERILDVAKLAVARAYIDAPPPGYGPDGERLEPADEPSGD